MIDLSALPVFLAAVAALLAVPGPDFFLITSQSVSHGARFGAACSAGIFLAGVLQTLLVAVGLGQIMETWPLVAAAVRLVGAIYLAYLGTKLLLAWCRRNEVPDHGIASPARPPRTLLLVGLVNNLLNPKALLFFSVFIPQFVEPGLGSPTVQIAIWGGLLSLVGFAYNLFLSAMFSAVRSLPVDVPRIQRHGQGVVGVLFLALAARLIGTRSA
jgi:threonine/homoserine/homoserine lactone efflux protein